MNDDTPKVLTERRGPLLIVTINRPQVKNACDAETAVQMNAAMDLLDDEESLFIGILTGSDGNFSTGADLKAVARGERATTDDRGGFGLFRRPPRKPLIAAVEGYAVGGGLELCLSCDLIVAARNALMGLPEVRHSVVAVGGGLFRLPRRIPYHIAMELALSGQIRDAAFFHQHGLANRLVEPGTALQEAITLAEGLLVNAPLAMAASKEIMRLSANWTDEEAWQKQAPIAARALDSEDRREGLAAFAEKRKPQWRGR
ncbi:carnitinyl-CoA dehydratase CaiD [Cupriavidus necator N-1]|uniref:Carnitinyl-CoA dehydratase CaiD n=1 Tax=Cupriavidus necator (strain ATCC 43291 / DSM 13513 / CCUG 52238 / LMG 8453 / N-1) TaxID=1042878 RepID=F8GSR2_CUPNN|nr:crotonase/enoyl-CoA hydratase family protein [Cupriavidus necator]AEI79831.1 carnitinyl-CoA dehydratase CaiD [Cupriavidus necator N-1]MDX6010533.1 crotonase/enoyl-CoA hydratase family protein [Cupriavidus necator]